MENFIQKLIERSVFFEKPGILSEKLKPLASSNYQTVEYFLLKFCAPISLVNAYEMVFYLSKSKKTCFLHTHRSQAFIFL